MVDPNDPNGHNKINEEYNKSYAQTRMRDVHTGAPLPGHPDYKKGGGGGGGCFPKGTFIWTPTGNFQIEKLKVGDLVWSRSNKGELEAKPILKHKVHKNQKLWRISFVNRNEVLTTAIHAFDCDGRWMRAKDITIGSKLCCVDLEGRKVIHQVEKSEEISRVEDVYNLIVADNFNFFADLSHVHSFSYLRGLRISVCRFVSIFSNNQNKELQLIQ